MNGNDRELGMGRAITRRNFVHAAAAGGAVAAGGMPNFAAAMQASPDPTVAQIAYPPLRNGFRGFHPGSFEPVHNLAWTGEAPPDAESTGEVYDLVVVGGGLSGLAAAYYYRKQAGPAARILILDNLQGVGGHAQRNEFEYEGRVLYAGGGSGYIVSPSDWSLEAKMILRDLGISKDASRDRTDRALYGSLGMTGGVLFTREQFGQDAVIKGSVDNPSAEFLARTPMSPRLRADMDKLVNDKTDYLAEKSAEEKIALLQGMSYRDYLLNIVGVAEEALVFVKGVWCLGVDMGSAWFAFFRMRPGFEGLGLTRPHKSPESDEASADDFNLPGGNSDVARLLVRALIPDAMPAGDLFEVADKRLDYSVLDREVNPTRIRQSSIVFNVRHLGPAPHLFEPEGREVLVSYLRDGRSVSVKAANVVMACMNNVIPHICPEVPDLQRTALTTALRAPNQVTNVLFRNWEAFQQAGLSGVTSPWTFYGGIRLGGQRYFGNVVPSRVPSEPIIVGFISGANSGILSNPNMVRGLCGDDTPEPGTPADDQFRAVRQGLLTAPFETFERNLRDLSARALAGTDFDPARDILGITVNRWSHGFATGRNSLFEEALEPGAFPPTVVARQKFGRIAIANSDAGGVSTMQTAFEQAYRAINDLQPRAYGFYEQI